jgi:beta-fructofuranosidase
VVGGPDGRWYLFYTGISTTDRSRAQRVGLAMSTDLVTWRRVGPHPLVEVDARWYQCGGLRHGVPISETWRDPFVFPDPDGDGWHMLITARVNGAAANNDGVLGHARSVDMRTWDVEPPITEPAGFGQIEVPQVRLFDGQPLLVFNCHPDEQTEQRKATWGLYSTWSVVGDSVIGPWDLSRAKPFTAEPALFAAPLIRQRDGEWVLVGFRNLGDAAPQSFEILDPIPVRLVDAGLTAVRPASRDARTQVRIEG